MKKLFQFLSNKLFCLYYVCLIYIMSAWYMLQELLRVHQKPKIADHPGKFALITGGGKGIGYETALQLLQAGMTVIIVGIKETQKEGVKCLQKEYKNCVKFLECDLSSLRSVKNLAVEFKALNLPLHLLVNNAGIMFAPWVETREVFESHWVINYLSHFLLTHLLLPTLIESASHSEPTRIVNLSSCLHYLGTINFEDTQGRICYSAEAAYTQSKLAMVLFSSTLARRLQLENVPVLVNSVHPAIAFTDLYVHVWWAKWMPNLARRVLKSAADASDTVIYAALSPQVRSGGNFFDNCHLRAPSSEARSVRVQERLWALSCLQAMISEYGAPK